MKKYLTLLLLFIPFSLARAEVLGPPITDNNYALDPSLPLVFGAPRKVAMGGADAASPDGVSALSDNPAAAAYRASSSTSTHDWDAALGTFYIHSSDLDNNGSQSASYESHRVLDVGLLYQYKEWGIGMYAVSQSYATQSETGEREVDLANAYLSIGRSHWRRQFTWGLGGKFAGMTTLPRQSSNSRVVYLTGGGLSAGAVYRPSGASWQIGASFFGPIKSREDLDTSQGPVIKDGLYVPSSITTPMQGKLGVARSWASAWGWTGHALTLEGDMTVIGKSDPRAYGVEALIDQHQQRVGQSITVSPQLGVEWALLPSWFRLRNGYYHEPSRFAGRPARDHFTGGFDCRLIRIPFRQPKYLNVQYAFDLSRHYVSHTVSVGFWRF